MNQHDRLNNERTVNDVVLPGYTILMVILGCCVDRRYLSRGDLAGWCFLSEGPMRTTQTS